MGGIGHIKSIEDLLDLLGPGVDGVYSSLTLVVPCCSTTYSIQYVWHIPGGTGFLPPTVCQLVGGFHGFCMISLFCVDFFKGANSQASVETSKRACQSLFGNKPFQGVEKAATLCAQSA